ncbi:hypothetical protein EMPS_04249 [Entomortierella parvispora]|uniref:Uncharacterized protein n=1 Tax=Entomortierella parvispora TaxID=205924 RepID=A0A9P3H8B7_9FUNG|nr:hypothetical protein EMPS_04249 [Entomortierella parvispora]
MILNSFLLQQDAFRKTLHPETEDLDPFTKIEVWEHIELRKLWFTYIRDRWTYPSNLYFTEAITYFLHGHCHGSAEAPLDDNAATMVRLDNLWAEYRDSFPFINDNGTLLRIHRQANQQAMDDVLTMLQALHGICEDQDVFDKYADNLGLIGKYRDLPLIWKRYPDNRFYALGPSDGSANSDEAENQEDGENGEDDDDNENGHGGGRPRSNRYGNRHHIASRRRSCDLYYDAPSSSQHRPPPVTHQAGVSHNSPPTHDERRQPEYEGDYISNHQRPARTLNDHLDDGENSNERHLQNQRHVPEETHHRPIENSSRTQTADYRPVNHVPPQNHTVDTRLDLHDNSQQNHTPCQEQNQHATRPSTDSNQVHAQSFVYRPPHRPNVHLNSSYQNNVQTDHHYSEYRNPLYQAAYISAARQSANSQIKPHSSANQSHFSLRFGTTFDGPRPRNDLDQYHLGSTQRYNHYNNSPGLFNRYGDRLQGSYGTGAVLSSTQPLQSQCDPRISQAASAMQHTVNISNARRVYSPCWPFLAPAAAEPVRMNDNNGSGNTPATVLAMAYSLLSQRFRFDQPDHPRFHSQAVDRPVFYPSVVTARPQGFITTSTANNPMAVQDMAELTSGSNAGSRGVLPPEVGNQAHENDEGRQSSGNGDMILDQHEGCHGQIGHAITHEGGGGGALDTDNSKDGRDSDIDDAEENKEKDVDNDDKEESSDNDESDNRSNTADYGGSRDDRSDDGSNGSGNGGGAGHDNGNDEDGDNDENTPGSDNGNDNSNNGDSDDKGNGNSSIDGSGTGSDSNDNGCDNSNNNNNGSGSGVDGKNSNNNDNCQGNDNDSRDDGDNVVNDSSGHNRSSQLPVESAEPESQEKKAKEAIASIQPVMTEYGEYLEEKRKALEGPRENLEKRRATLRKLKRVAQRVQDQFDERDALAEQAKSIDFQFRVCDDQMSKVLLDISMSNTYMSSALKRKRGQEQ